MTVNLHRIIAIYVDVVVVVLVGAAALGVAVVVDVLRDDPPEAAP